MVQGRTVTGVLSGGPAFYAGNVEIGDFITAVDGQTGMNESEILIALIGNHGPGHVTLNIERGGKGGPAHTVVLRREDTTMLLDRLKMFELMRQMQRALETESMVRTRWQHVSAFAKSKWSHRC